MSDAVKSLLDAIEGGAAHDAEQIFNNEVSSRLSTALDNKKVEVASTMTTSSNED
jgi:hypothetical protein